MKYVVFFFLFISTSAYTQSVKSRIQGEWLCSDILDSSGNESSGKFGKPDNYLKFNFRKGFLFITQAPFDKGIQIPISFKHDSIYIMPDAVIKLPENFYAVSLLSEDSLILITKNAKNENIYYHFVNQDRWISRLSKRPKIIDEGAIIIKHVKSSKESKYANRVAEYLIKGGQENLLFSPIFNDYSSATFGSYFAINFIFPKNFEPNSMSRELVIDFDVTDKGLQNIKILKGLDDEINAAVIKTITRTKKKWKPVKVDNRPFYTTLRFHFVFYLGIESFFSDK